MPPAISPPWVREPLSRACPAERLHPRFWPPRSHHCCSAAESGAARPPPWKCAPLPIIGGGGGHRGHRAAPPPRKNGAPPWLIPWALSSGADAIHPSCPCAVTLAMVRRETSSTSAAVASRLRSRVPPHQVLLQLTTSHGVCPVQRRQRHCLSWIAPQPTQMASGRARIVRLHAAWSGCTGGSGPSRAPRARSWRERRPAPGGSLRWAPATPARPAARGRSCSKAVRT